jgi:uncharacterized protein (UPF0254 family)
VSYVTDHAVLRWLERVAGVDVEAVRRHLSVDAVDTAAKIGCGTVIMGDGVRLKLTGDVVSTVIEARKKRVRR